MESFVNCTPATGMIGPVCPSQLVNAQCWNGRQFSIQWVYQTYYKQEVTTEKKMAPATSCH
jgi:hypothetical protein